MNLRTGKTINSIFKRSYKYKDMQEDELKHLKKVFLSIGDDFVALCDKYDLCYGMAYGTALGAVRHKGFIPWDDDMDFFMPRKDYEKFIMIAKKELSDKYWICSTLTYRKHSEPTCKIKKKNTKYINYGDLTSALYYPDETKGIYIDIFPMDNTFNNAVLRYIKGIISLGILFVISCVDVHNEIKQMKKHNIILSKEEKNCFFIKDTIGKIFGIFPSYKWMKFYEWISKLNKNNNSKYITCYAGLKNMKKETYIRDKVFDTTYAAFESRKWKIPKNSDYYLSHIYGDYMTLPPKSERATHPVLELEFDD